MIKISYNKQSWVDYDDSISEQQNLQNGGVVSSDRLNHIENGVRDASLSIPTVELTGDTSKMTGDVSVPLQFDYTDGQRDVSGYVSAKWQGDTSQNYPKKNYKISLYSDSALKNKLKIRPGSSFGNDNKFNLKADWIDVTHARNLANSRVYANIVANHRYHRTATVENLFYDSLMENTVIWNYDISAITGGISDKVSPAGFPMFEVNVPSTDATHKWTVIKSDTIPYPVSYVAGGGVSWQFKAFTKALSTQNVAQTLCVAIKKWNSKGNQIGQYSTNFYYGSDTLKANDFATLTGRMPWSADTDTDVKAISFAIFIPADGDVAVSEIGLYDSIPTATPEYRPSVRDVYSHLKYAHRFGEVDGLPVEVYINGTDQGLYNFETTKDNNLWAMNKSNPQHEVVTGANSSANFTQTSANLDGTVYGTEINSSVTPTMQSNFNELLNFIASSTNDKFKAGIGNYIDIDSVIDRYLWGLLSYDIDAFYKSWTLITYDKGLTWYMGAYDMDSTWQLKEDGSGLSAKSYYQSSYMITNGGGNNLMKRIVALFPDMVSDRYKYLRANGVTPSTVINQFKDYMNGLSPYFYVNDLSIWPAIPSASITSFRQISECIENQFQFFDDYYGY